MTERTPEFYQIDKIMDEVIAGGWFDVIDRTIRVDSHAISRLAAPLEAANARIRELEAENTRLRQIEAAARAANLIGPDGKVRELCADARHPLPLLGDESLYVNASYVWYSADGHPVAETCVEDVGVSWTQHGWVFEFDDFDLPLSDCYSTPESAQAARKEPNETR